MEEYKRNTSKKIDKTWWIGLGLIIIFYSIFSFAKNSPSMPSIIKIAESMLLIFFSPEFYENVFCTIKIVTIGVLLSTVIGFGIGVLCSYFKTANLLITPVMNLVKNIPSVALFPLFIILMGIGDAPRISIIIWNSIYAVMSNTMFGLSDKDKKKLLLADNKIYSMGTDNYSAIEEILQELGQDSDFEIPGYDSDILEEMYGVKSVEEEAEKIPSLQAIASDSGWSKDIKDVTPSKHVEEAREEAVRNAEKFVICPNCGGKIYL